jgi:dynein heavy chain, axonemal
LNIPIFFILSPGADPVKEVENMGVGLDFTQAKNNWFNIALGQGQDVVAEERLEAGVKDGHWIMLQNVHLMPSWLPTLEKKLDDYSKKGGSNIEFRLFLSAEPSKGIPIGILERCIKLTNEPPAGLKANMNRAWTYFNPASIDKLDVKIRPILFGLCYFHSTLLERRKFGPKGWNMFYPFNIGDLRDSYFILEKNIENGMGRIPWDDLKYIFGEIMYGGHIVDDWDRRLCSAYLDHLMTPKILMEDFELFPYCEDKDKFNFKTPSNTSCEKYKDQIEISLTIVGETPIGYGMHPNAEIGLGKDRCELLFETLVELQPRDVEANTDAVQSSDKADRMYVKKVIEEWVIKEKIMNIEDIKEKCGEVRTPY